MKIRVISCNPVCYVIKYLFLSRYESIGMRNVISTTENKFFIP